MPYLAIILMLFFALIGCTAGSESKEAFNIVLITIDTLRADHLSCYGYHRKTSPVIDSIAAKGILYKNAIAPCSWTSPSMASLFTSVYPTNHGVIHGLGYRKDVTLYVQEIFSEQLTTLTEALKAQGYTTFGVASNLALGEKFGFGRGFDHFECLDGQPAVNVNKVLYQWEDAIRKSAKFFIWVHYFDPHAPYFSRSPWIDEYSPRELTQKLGFFKTSFQDLVKRIPELEQNRDMLGNLVALYDSEINYVDSFVGEFINKYKFGEDTLLIITSDHGEGFLEHHLLGHGNSLHQESICIPLIIKLPGSHQKEIDERYVTLLDIMPTILDLLGSDSPDHIRGTSILPEKQLFPLLSQLLPWKHETRDAFSELHALSLKTIVSSGWKYLYSYTDGRESLYNIENDPLERTNLIAKEEERGRSLKTTLLNWAAQAKKYPTTRNERLLSKEEQEKLEALGYAGTIVKDKIK